MKQRVPVFLLGFFLLLPVARGGEKKAPRNIVIRRNPAGEVVTRLFPLHSLSFDEIEAFCRDFLSRDGRLGYFAARRTLVVHDHQKNVEEIRDFLAKTDREQVMIRVKVEFLQQGTATRGGVSTTWDKGRNKPKVIIENGHIRLNTPVSVQGNLQHNKEFRRTVMQVLTASGSPACLKTMRRLPDPAWLEAYRFVPIYRRYPVRLLPYDAEHWRDVGSALYVTPTLLDNGLIDLAVFPAVTYIDDRGHRRAVMVQNLQTRIQAANGQSVHIGGGTREMRRFSVQLFGPEFSANNGGGNLDIRLTPQVVTPHRPGGRPRAPSPSKEKKENER